MFKRLTFYPFLFAAYPLLFLWSENAESVSAAQVLLPLGVLLAVVALIWFAAAKWFRSAEKGALFAAVLSTLFFLYGHLYLFVFPVALSTELGSRNALTLENDLGLIIVCLFLLLLAVLSLILRRVNSIGKELLATLNIVSLALVFFALGNVVVVKVSLARSNDAGLSSSGTLNSSLAPATQSTLGYLPDIYHIVLDGYARADVLQQHFAWDNSEIINFLGEEGFDVLDKSTANYFWTMLSLGSTLNMDYLLSDETKDGRELQAIYQHLRNNKVLSFLKDKGYRTIHFQSSWGATLNNPYADEQIGCAKSVWQDEFRRLVVETTMLRFLEGRAGKDLAECHLEQIELLKQSAKWSGPKYVFAHFIPPHHPYLFDSSGNINKRVVLANQFDFQNQLWADKDSYLQQLQFVNSEIKAIVSALKEQSTQPPIIIIHSDHGPQLLDSSREEHLEARFANLVAVYLAGARGVLPEDEVAVNLFRDVLKFLFKLDLAPLEHRHFYSSYQQPFDFKEINIEK